MTPCTCRPDLEDDVYAARLRFPRATQAQLAASLGVDVDLVRRWIARAMHRRGAIVDEGLLCRCQRSRRRVTQ